MEKTDTPNDPLNVAYTLKALREAAFIEGTMDGKGHDPFFQNECRRVTNERERMAMDAIERQRRNDTRKR